MVIRNMSSSGRFVGIVKPLISAPVMFSGHESGLGQVSIHVPIASQVLTRKLGHESGLGRDMDQVPIEAGSLNEAIET
ncbi:hypothetical protein LIER_04253 [Lithospermum erythrorhizon]|uniref:Uncharacterized protein n=1 Tax=Lithospermum erythrorhizon TaxID=34254 RepID=A0AAV3P0S4_LITER